MTTFHEKCVALRDKFTKNDPHSALEHFNILELIVLVLRPLTLLSWFNLMLAGEYS